MPGANAGCASRTERRRVVVVLGALVLCALLLSSCGGDGPARPAPEASPVALTATTCDELASSRAVQAAFRDVDARISPSMVRFGDVELSLPAAAGRDLRVDWRAQDSRWHLKLRLRVTRPFSTLRMSGHDLATGAPVEFEYSAEGRLVGAATYTAEQSDDGIFYGAIGVARRGIVELVYEIDGIETARVVLALCQGNAPWQSMP